LLAEQAALYHRRVSPRKADDDDAADEKSDGKPRERTIPPTRRHESVQEPAARPSYHDLMNPVVTYPDDGSVSGALRSFDTLVGRVEQVLLVSILSIVVFVAATSAIADKVADAHPFGHFKDDVIRGGTFAMALLGAAFATHQARHLSMDLISRRLSPRARLVLKVLLALFTIAIVALLIRAGFHTIATEEEIPGKDKLITPVRLAYLVPIGGAMIILHTFLHMVIDIDYLARGKTPPEKMRTGH
jgi:TRAP-type C4-dicarboxylate transport system permease small subunit